VVCSKAVLEMSRQRREKTCSRRSSKNKERDRNGKTK
jgi:predicted nucleic acid-binding Zn ribbon protein